MITRLIILILGNGQIKVLLQGEGKPRLEMLKAYERLIEGEIPVIQQRIKQSLEVVSENSNFNFN